MPKKQTFASPRPPRKLVSMSVWLCAEEVERLDLSAERLRTTRHRLAQLIIREFLAKRLSPPTP